MSDQLVTHYSRSVIRGHRRRRLLNQIITFLGFHAPGFGARIWLNRLKGAQIGENCWIGDNVTLDLHYAHPDRQNSLILGDRVSVGPGVRLFTHDTAFTHISRGQLPIQFGHIKIGTDTWIGPHSVIANCTIGHHCVITPNSVVTHDIPDYSLVRGNPGVVVVDLRRVMQRMKVPVED